jgi:3'-phosphoadenosine 5'-phosphosulfate sulfotransferase (PAPS reductase)/FAD synthetase
MKPVEIQKIHYAGLSGGKDSTALAIWMIKDSGYPLDSLRFTFCDTGNEHDLTYQYLYDLSKQFVQWGATAIEWLKAELDFYQLAEKKGRFPSTKARFCTQHLKMIVTKKDTDALQERGYELLLHTGVRRDESPSRAKLDEYEFDTYYGANILRPILNWTYDGVVEYVTKIHGIPLNPLYGYGARRVGCFPCINSSKSEIRIIATKFPERIEKIRQWEEKLNSTFFPPNKVPDRYKSRTVYSKKKGREVGICSIDDVVRWSMTSRGAKNYELLFDDDNHLSCNSSMGACE